MIWVAGCSGLLGTELVRLLRERGQSFLGTARDVDIRDTEALASVARGKEIGAIVNCAGYTNVDAAEDDEALSLEVNAAGARNLACVAKAINAQLIHISTDYVFDGHKRIPYTEDDPLSPLSAYGRSKAEGERLVMEADPDAIILRTSWLYGAYGACFARTMLRLMAERDSVSVVSDQVGCPTWARDLARAIMTIADRARLPSGAVPGDSPGIPGGEEGVSVRLCPGIYHYAGEGPTTWYDYAKEIQRLGRSHGILTRDCRVEPITSDLYGAKAARPAYSVLCNDMARAAGLRCWPWKARLEAFLKGGWRSTNR